MSEERINLRNLFSENCFVDSDDRQLLAILIIVAREGVELSALRNVIPFEKRRLQTCVDNMLALGALEYLGTRRVRSTVSFPVSHISLVVRRVGVVNGMLQNLRERTTLTHTDMLEDKRSYFIIQRLLLKYLYESTFRIPLEVDYNLFVENVSCLLYNYNLSFNIDTKVPDGIAQPNEKFFCKLADFALLYVVPGSLLWAELDLHLGKFYTEAFWYLQADLMLESARELLDKSNDTAANRVMIEVMLAKSRYFYLRSQISKAALWLHKAYKLAGKVYGLHSAECAYVMIKIAELFAHQGCEDDAQRWKEKALQHMPKPYNEKIRILLFLIDAGIYSVNLEEGLSNLDQASALAMKLYGTSSPMQGCISFIRSLAYSAWGMESKVDDAYEDYVNCNHLNYGKYIDADTIMHFSAKVISNVSNGCYWNTGKYFSFLHACGLAQCLPKIDITSSKDNIQTASGLSFHPGSMMSSIQMLTALRMYSPGVIVLYYKALATYWHTAVDLKAYKDAFDNRVKETLLNAFMSDEEEMRAVDELATNRGDLLNCIDIYNVINLKAGLDYENGDKQAYEKAYEEMNSINERLHMDNFSLLKLYSLFFITLPEDLDVEEFYNTHVAAMPGRYKLHAGIYLASRAIEDDRIMAALEFCTLSLSAENILNSYTGDIIYGYRTFAKILEYDGQLSEAEYKLAEAKTLVDSVDYGDELLVDIYLDWAVILYNNQRWEDALEKHNKAIETYKVLDDVTDEREALLYAQKGKIYFEMNQLENARIWYKKAVECFPLTPGAGHVDYLFSLVEIDMQLGDYDSARSYLNEIKENESSLTDEGREILNDYMDSLNLYDPQ